MSWSYADLLLLLLLMDLIVSLTHDTPTLYTPSGQTSHPIITIIKTRSLLSVKPSKMGKSGSVIVILDCLSSCINDIAFVSAALLVLRILNFPFFGLQLVTTIHLSPYTIGKSTS